MKTGYRTDWSKVRHKATSRIFVGRYEDAEPQESAALDVHRHAGARNALGAVLHAQNVGGHTQPRGCLGNHPLSLGSRVEYGLGR
jgi:hypothetical protein